MQDDPHKPIRTLSYRLTRADALAYHLLKHELTGWEKFRFMVFIASGGLIVGLLPDNVGTLAWWSIAVGVMLVFGIMAVVWSNVTVRRKAATMALPQGSVELEEWGDHLVERSATGLRHVALETIAQVLATDTHVFVREGKVPLILPLAAFEDAVDMQGFAAALDDASERAQP